MLGRCRVASFGGIAKTEDRGEARDLNDSVGIYHGAPVSGRLSTEHAVRVLAVGNTETWRSEIGRIPVHRDLRFYDIDDIDVALLAEVRPGLVVSPVLASNFDCLDLAFRLSYAGYRGAYRALSNNLPKPEIIRSEVRAICPEINFDIIPMESASGPIF